MIRTLNIVLFFFISLLCTSGYTTSTHNFSPATTIIEELPPNDPQIFVNFLLWRIKGSCELISESVKNPVSFKMLTKKGTLNGVEFSEGDSLYLVVQAGQLFELSADARAKVEIINHGTKTIKIKCTNS